LLAGISLAVGRALSTSRSVCGRPWGPASVRGFFASSIRCESRGLSRRRACGGWGCWGDCLWTLVRGESPTARALPSDVLVGGVVALGVLVVFAHLAGRCSIVLEILKSWDRFPATRCPTFGCRMVSERTRTGDGDGAASKLCQAIGGSVSCRARIGINTRVRGPVRSERINLFPSHTVRASW